MPATEIAFRLRVLRLGAQLTLGLAAAGAAYAALTWSQPHRAVLVAGAIAAFADGLLMLRFPPVRLFRNGHADAVMAVWNVSHAVMITLLCCVDGGVDSPLVVIFFTGVVFAAIDQRRATVLAIAALDCVALVVIALVTGHWDGHTVFAASGLMAIAAMSVAIATDRQARTGALEGAQRELVHRLARVVEHRDSDTAQHVDRMSAYCGLIARRLGWSEHACEALQLASTMHDVGKVGVPDAILLKPGPLTPEERAIMERHAQLGHDMLAGSESPVVQLAAVIALTHHERFDGTGYPQRLAGTTIPIEGRIVAAADVFDALTSDRVYRPAMPADEALAILEQGRGSHFDPAVVDALFAALPEILAIAATDGNAAAGSPPELRQAALALP